MPGVALPSAASPGLTLPCHAKPRLDQGDYMPGNLNPANPIDVIPAGFYTALSEELRIESFVNQYADGSSDRVNLAQNPRHFFRITRRMTSAQYSALWTFFSNHLISPFFFYLPRETQPPFTPDPTGAATSGRYTVVWDGNWSDQVQLGRSEVSLGLREVV